MRVESQQPDLQWGFADEHHGHAPTDCRWNAVPETTKDVGEAL